MTAAWAAITRMRALTGALDGGGCARCRSQAPSRQGIGSGRGAVHALCDMRAACTQLFNAGAFRTLQVLGSCCAGASLGH